MGHSISLQDESEPNQVLLADPIPDFDVEEAQDSRNVLYKATFEELSEAHLQYDTTIWVLISLLLVLAWGLGIVMLIFLPVRRYVLRKDISSRKLYITPCEIVYKATRPFFLPCLGINKIEKRIPLPLVIDIIIEQGCLQSVYGIHTFRVEGIARGKAAPIDELQIQGVSDPGLLRKVIISEASKSIQGMGRIWKPTLYGSEVGSTPKKGIESLSGISSLIRSPSLKGMASPRHGLPVVKAVVPSDLLLHKLEEVKQSMQRIESLLVVPQELGESI